MAKENPLVAEKIQKGWIHTKMFFEVMGASEEITKNALEDHLKKIKKMDNVKIVDEKIEKIEKVENPPEKMKSLSAYSQFAEVELLVSSLENLIYAVIFFGPSGIEIIAPKEMRVTFDSAQSMANAVAEMMHKYAAGGFGGIVISTKD